MIGTSNGQQGIGQQGTGQRGTGQQGTTGRRLVVFGDATSAGGYADVLRRVAGLTDVASTADFRDRVVDPSQTRRAQATVFADLGIAVVAADDDQASALAAQCSSDGDILAVEPERVHRILSAPGVPPTPDRSEYLRGYADGVADLVARLGAGAASVRAAAPVADTDAFTWGLIATGVSTTTATGAGVRVAVLDTGLDLTHPDFAGREITSAAFVDGVTTAQDGHGHGTHCVGTSCGPKAPTAGRRYGIAYEAAVFVGKVLGDDGSGADEGILAGLNWALTNRVDIVSMSLGADVRAVSTAYETVGRRALAAGTLIVAAAGNNANRPADPGFVGVPANSPSIAAVAATDQRSAIAPFSARSTDVEGGNVDFAGPGVDVYSSWPVFPPGSSEGDGASRYTTISGTSMATPHVAGIAALWAQTTGRRGRDLWTTLTQQARRLDVPASDVGAGLVQAPR
ncbi:S8 family serine peptidase [Williamsia deligens]|uniref:S8 family serine peptidase n=1 Tax=Williamsia deligens TaxID=321325 RepID=A0ABW3G988_9NOCA|nr:S8 family serine peptidase [Williamsia deligens]MCP2192512.1 Subtilase family protein [Williamsia deligens]